MTTDILQLLQVTSSEENPIFQIPSPLNLGSVIVTRTFLSFPERRYVKCRIELVNGFAMTGNSRYLVNDNDSFDVSQHKRLAFQRTIENLKNYVENRLHSNKGISMSTKEGLATVTTEQELEKEIQEKGLNAPRVTPDMIDDAIMKADYFIVDETITYCVLTLKNGHRVTGEAFVVSKENFNKETGEKAAFRKAREKIWDLEGYLLRELVRERVQPLVKIRMIPEEIARVCHEVNRAYCEAAGDTSQVSWEESTEAHRNSILLGVKFSQANPDSTPEDQHNNWMKQKKEEGWVYGPEKLVELKQHPCMIPYDALPFSQRVKDNLFKATVKALSS